MENRFQTACHLIEKQEFESARSLLEELINENDVNQEVHSKHGVACAGLGRFDEAIICFEKALRMEPDYTSAIINMGNIYFELGDNEQAKRLYEKAINNNDGNCLAPYNMAVLNKRCGNYGEYFRNLKEYRRLLKKQLKQRKIKETSVLQRL